MLKKHQSKLILYQFYPKSYAKTKKVCQSINYIGMSDMSDRIAKYLTNENKSLIPVNKINLNALLVNSKGKTDRTNKSGVYEVKFAI